MARVAAAAVLLAGCATQTTTVGGGNPSGYGLGRTLVAVDFAPEPFRQAVELKLAEQLADLEVPASVSYRLVGSSTGPVVLGEAARLGRFDSVLLLWGYSRAVTSVEVQEPCDKLAYGETPSQRPKVEGVGAQILVSMLFGVLSAQCKVTRTERRVDVKYRATLYDVPTRRPVWEGTSSRNSDRSQECFAAGAAYAVVNWLKRDALLPGRPPFLPVSGEVLASCLLP